MGLGLRGVLSGFQKSGCQITSLEGYYYIIDNKL